MFATLTLTPETLSRFRALYFALAPDYPHSILLDSCGWQGKTGGFYMMGFDAKTVVTVHGQHLCLNDEPVGPLQDKKSLFQQLISLFPTTSAKAAGSWPFSEGWVGALGYEFNHFLEPRIPKRLQENPFEAFYFVQFRHRIVWHPESLTWEVLSDDPHWKARVKSILKTLSSQKLSFKPQTKPIQSSLSQVDFEARVLQLKDRIREGELYQANLSMRFSIEQFEQAELFSVYQALVNKNPSPFSGIFQTPQFVILSNSPERLVKFDAKTNQLETRPIAGTRGRGQTQQETSQIEAVLKTDPKEQAEHLMMVDLERNDLGRVSQAGSVNVPEVGIVEQYSHVTHLVSQVEGQKADGKNAWDILEAMFPGGTITGCPKVRCMEILHDLEPVARGFYTGSLGYIDVSGNLDFNILIRSLFYQPVSHQLFFHAGAGIVADSVPAWEYRECLRKAQVIQGVLSHDQSSPTPGNDYFLPGRH